MRTSLEDDDVAYWVGRAILMMATRSGLARDRARATEAIRHLYADGLPKPVPMTDHPLLSGGDTHRAGGVKEVESLLFNLNFSGNDATITVGNGLVWPPHDQGGEMVDDTTGESHADHTIRSKDRE